MVSMLVPINLLCVVCVCVYESAGGCACGRNPISEFWNCRATLSCASSILSQYIASSNEWGIYNRKYHVKHVRQQISPQLSHVSTSSRKRDNFRTDFPLSHSLFSVSPVLVVFDIKSNLPQRKYSMLNTQSTQNHTRCGSWYRKCFVCSQWGCISWCTGTQLNYNDMNDMFICHNKHLYHLVRWGEQNTHSRCAGNSS